MEQINLESKWWYRLIKVFYVIIFLMVFIFSFVAIYEDSKYSKEVKKPVKSVNQYYEELNCVNETDEFEKNVCWEIAKLRNKEDQENSLEYKWVANWEKVGYYIFFALLIESILFIIIRKIFLYILVGSSVNRKE